MKKQTKVKVHGAAPASDFIALGSKISDDTRSALRPSQCLSNNPDWRNKHLRKRPNSLSEGNIDPLTFHDSLNLVLSRNDAKEIEAMILNAIEYIRCNKPCSYDTYIAFELGYFAKLKPSLFQSEIIVETLCSVLRAANALPFTYKQRTGTNLPMIIVGILSNAFVSVPDWPLSLLRCYLEDATSDRLWVDQPDCSWFVDNVVRAFNTKKISIKVDLENFTDEMNENLEIVESDSSTLGGSNKDEQTRFTLYKSYEINKLTVGIITTQLNRRPDSRHIMKTLCVCCGLKEIRELVISKLENWLHNPKFFKHGLELLLSIFANCSADDDVIFQEMVRMRIRTKSALNYYLFGMKELVRIHGNKVLKSLLSHVVHTEISSMRTGISFNLMAALFSTSSKDSSYFFGFIVHTLLLKEYCLKNVRLFIRELYRHVKQDFNFISFCTSFFSEDVEYFAKLLCEHDINACESFISSLIDIYAMTVFLCINSSVRDYFLTKSSQHFDSWERFAQTISQTQISCVRFLQVTVPAIYAEKVDNRSNPESQMHCLKEYVPCLYKSLFMEHPERYYKVDDWPIDTDRGIFFRIVSEIPPSEEILYRVLQIGCDCNLPLIPLNALELEEQLLRRIAATSSGYITMSTQNSALFFDILNKIPLYNVSLSLASEKIDFSKFAFCALFWKSSLVILLFVCFCSSVEFATLVWTKLATVRMLIEMILTNDYMFPPQCSIKKPFNTEETFLLHEANLVEKEKTEIHDLEVKLCVTDNSYQLVNNIMKVDNTFPRRPSQEFLDKLKALNNLHKLAQRLCKSREPDFLLDIIESHMSNETLLWLPQLIQSSIHCLAALPIRCLCEFLFNSRRSCAPNLDTVLEVLKYLNKSFFSVDATNDVRRDIIIEFFSVRCTSPLHSFRDASWDCLFSLIYPTSEQFEIDLGVAVRKLFTETSPDQILLNICKSLKIDVDFERIYNVLLAFLPLYFNVRQKKDFRQCFVTTLSFLILHRRKVLDAMFSLAPEQVRCLTHNFFSVFYHAFICTDLYEKCDTRFIVLRGNDVTSFFGDPEIIHAAAYLLLYTSQSFIISKERNFLTSVLLTHYPVFSDGSCVYEDEDFYRNCFPYSVLIRNTRNVSLHDLEVALLNPKLVKENYAVILHLLDEKLSSLKPNELLEKAAKVRQFLKMKILLGCTETQQLYFKYWSSINDDPRRTKRFKFDKEITSCERLEMFSPSKLDIKIALQKVLDKRVTLKERRSVLLSLLYSTKTDKTAIFKELIAMIRSGEGKAVVIRMNEDVAVSLSVLRFIRLSRGNDAFLTIEEQELLKLLKYYETFGKSAFTFRLRMIVASTEKLLVKPKRFQSQSCTLTSKDVMPILFRDPRELEALYSKMICKISLADKIKCCEEAVVTSESILNESVIGMLLDEILLSFDCVMQLHDRDMKFLFRKDVSDNVKNILCSHILRSLSWQNIIHILKSILRLYDPNVLCSSTIVNFVIGFIDHSSLNPVGFAHSFRCTQLLRILDELEIKNLIFYIFDSVSDLENLFLPSSENYFILQSRLFLLNYLLHVFKNLVCSALMSFIRTYVLNDSQMMLLWKLYLLDPNRLSFFVNEIKSNYDMFRFVCSSKVNKCLFNVFNSIIDFSPTKKAELHLFEVSLVLRDFAVTHPFLLLLHLSTLNILLQGKSSGCTQPEFKYKRYHLLFGYVMHLIQLMLPYILKAGFHDILESILDQCFEVSVLYFVNDLSYMTYKFLSLLEKYASFDSKRVVQYLMSRADVILSFPHLNQFDALKLCVNTVRYAASNLSLCDGSVNQIKKKTFNFVVGGGQKAASSFTTLHCGDYKEFQVYRSKVDMELDVMDIIEALTELDKVSKINPLVIDAFIPDLCLLMKHENSDVRALVYSLILKRLTFDPSCYKLFYSSYLMCLCSNNVDVVQTALKDYTEFFVFSHERAIDLLNEAFRAGIRHRIDISQCLSNAVSLLKLQQNDRT